MWAQFVLTETTKCCRALKQPLMSGDWEPVCGKLFLIALKPPNPDLKYNESVCNAMFMVCQYLQHISTTISFYSRWKAMSDYQGQKCWHIWAKQTHSIGAGLSAVFQSFIFVDSLTPLSPFSTLKYASLTLSRGYNIEKERGGRNEKTRVWKTHAFNETGLSRGVSQLLFSMIVD